MAAGSAGPFAYPVDLCVTDRVSFCRTGDRRRAPVPLDEIPGLVFSEAMRDVDLFVSVTSIALDPGGPTAARTRTSPTGGSTRSATASGRAMVMLPFDGDQMLSIIVSKATLLAADDTITDPAITRELNAR